MPILDSYESFLQANQYADETILSEARIFNRKLLNHILENQPTFTNIPRESLAFVTILLNAERIRLNKNLLLAFIAENLQNERFTKISQIRKCRGYTLLSNFAKFEGNP